MSDMSDSVLNRRTVRVAMTDDDGNTQHATATWPEEDQGERCIGCNGTRAARLLPDDPRTSNIHICLTCLVSDDTITSISIS